MIKSFCSVTVKILEVDKLISAFKPFPRGGTGMRDDKATAGQSETGVRVGGAERWRPERKKLLALHFRLVAPCRGQFEP